MKGYKYLVPVLLILALVGSVFYLIDRRSDTANAYVSALRQARESIDNGVIADGIKSYEEALAIHSTPEVYMEVGNVYLNTNDLQSAKRWYEQEFLVRYPDSPLAYEFGLRTNIARGNYQDAFAVYDTCTKREVTSEAITELVDSIRYQYRLLGKYTDVRPFSNTIGYAAVEYMDRWGYVNSEGEQVISYSYQSAELFGDYAAVIDLNGEAFYIDKDNNKKITTDFFENEGEKIEVFRSIQSNLILAYNGKTWNYYNAENYQKLFGGYTDATVITNGVGGVTKDGTNWALINTEGQEITDYVFKQVITDNKGVPCRTQSLFVEQNGKFWLVDSQGKKLNNHGYDAVYAFNEDSWAAVQKNGKWIFVNSAGKEKDLGNFEEAKSFSNGFAAVKVDGKWGYIDLDGNLVIDCSFYDAGEFNQLGASFVQTDENEWKLLHLYSNGKNN